MDSNLEMYIRIEVRQKDHPGPGIELQERLDLKPRSFLECCKVLGQFDELVKTIKESEGKR